MKPKKQNLEELLILLFFVITSHNVTSENDVKKFTYNAAVVEYYPVHNSKMSYEENVNYTVNDYIKLLNEIKEDVDIVVFPEATLTPLRLPLNNKPITEVPEPLREFLYNSTNPKYLPFLKQLSEAAVNKRVIIVVNLIEKENCTLLDSAGLCPPEGVVYHNTDVVLNEEGTVSARYRKYNLFGEPGLTPSPQPEIVNFTTKINETFAIFTCFDIMFKKPALMLPKHGFRNLLFITMWFSELPYLTALQVQQMWSQENDITLISSGANNPREGSGGTGIFIGTKGPLNQTIISGSGGTQVLVQTVPKIEIIDNPYMNEIHPLEDDIDVFAENLDDFYIMQDPSMLKGHTSVLLNTKVNEIKEEVCNGAEVNICCHFHIKFKYDEQLTLKGKNAYTYHLAAFNGVRTFAGFRDGGIEACAVLACLNASITSCGIRFPKYRDVQWPITFEQINVSAEFSQSDERIQYPNSVLASLRSISPQYTSWIRQEVPNGVRRDHILNKPYNKVLTFGIFGRDFSRDSPYPSLSETLKSSYVTTILSTICAMLMLIKMY